MTYQRTTGTRQRAERRARRASQLIFCSRPLMFTTTDNPVTGVSTFHLEVAPVTGRTMRYADRLTGELVTASYPPFVD